MKLANLVFIFIALIALTTLTHAQAPVQPAATAPAKVGVINSDLFSKAGGITRLVNALRTLETEFKPRRDEITQLVSRFDALQQAPPANTTQAQMISRREQAETLQIEIRRKQEDARVAYSRRLNTLVEPIRQSIFNALGNYAKGRGVDVLIDINKFPDGVLLLNQAVDLSPGFIRDFNSKNP